MDKKIKLITKIVVGALVAIALVFQILMIIKSSMFATITPEAIESPVLGGYLNMAYVTFGIALVIALIFPIIHMFSNPKSALKGLVGVGIIVVLGLISYLLSSNELTQQQLDKLNVTENISVWVGAGINLSFIIGIVAILSAIFLAIKGSISK